MKTANDDKFHYSWRKVVLPDDTEYREVTVFDRESGEQTEVFCCYADGRKERILSNDRFCDPFANVWSRATYEEMERYWETEITEK